MIVFLSTLGWAWPAVAPIVGSVAAGLGYKIMAEPTGALRGRLTNKLENMRRETVPLDAGQTEALAGELQDEERLIFERGEMILVFRKDARGKFFVEALGPVRQSAMNLKTEAAAFAGEIIRKFAYNRLAGQLQRYGGEVVAEETELNGRVTLTVRRWKEKRRRVSVRQ